MSRVFCIWLAVACVLGAAPQRLAIALGSPCCSSDCCSRGREVREAGCSMCASAEADSLPVLTRGCSCDHDDPGAATRIPPQWLAAGPRLPAEGRARPLEPSARLRPRSRRPRPRTPPPRRQP